jgi:hypothetical protein
MMVCSWTDIVKIQEELVEHCPDSLDTVHVDAVLLFKEYIQDFYVNSKLIFITGVVLIFKCRKLIHLTFCLAVCMRIVVH